MSVIPVAFSLMASFVSAITLLGLPKEIYADGTQWLFVYVVEIFATIISCYIYLPVIFSMQKTSVYEYLECRFGKATKMCASLAYTVQQILYVGVVIYAPSLAIAAVTGIAQNWTILVVCLSCTISTSFGGMKAVLAADILQSLLMITALASVSFKGLIDFGITGIFQQASKGGRIEFFNFSPDPKTRHTFWNVSIGGTVAYLVINSVNQTQVQRLLTTRSLKQARMSLWIQYLIGLLLGILMGISALTLYAEYHSCDPLTAGQISKADQILPFYVMEKLGPYPGVPGLFLAGIFSGSLSSISSAVNSLTAVTLHDYLMPFFAKISTPKWQKKTAILSKTLSFTYGLIFMGAAYVIGLLGKSVLQISQTVLNSIGGPILGLFTLGMLSSAAHQKGAVLGFFAGIVFPLWIAFGEPKYPHVDKPTSIEGCSFLNGTTSTTVFPLVDVVLLGEEEASYSSTPQFAANPTLSFNATEAEGFNLLKELYSISYMWLGTTSFLVTCIVGYTSSYLIPGRKKVDPELLSQIYFLIWGKRKEAASVECRDNQAMELQEYPALKDGRV